MKRSGNVGLVLMGGAAFAATFAGGMAYLAWQKPSHAAPSASSPAAQAQCTPRPDGTQNCQPVRRSFTHYLLPHYFSGGSSSSVSAESKPMQSAALTSNSRSYAPAAGNGTVRGGFGSTSGSPSFRVAAGG
jgi:hypothetical protein